MWPCGSNRQRTTSVRKLLNMARDVRWVHSQVQSARWQTDADNAGDRQSTLRPVNTEHHYVLVSVTRTALASVSSHLSVRTAAPHRQTHSRLASACFLFTLASAASVASQPCNNRCHIVFYPRGRGNVVTATVPLHSAVFINTSISAKSTVQTL